MSFERFLLKSSTRWTTIEPIHDSTPHHPVLHLSHQTGQLTTRTPLQVSTLSKPSTTTEIFGLFGVISLHLDTYLIIIKSRHFICTLHEEPIYKAKLALIPLLGIKNLKKTNKKEDIAKEIKFRNGLQQVINMDGYYYSYTFDLTRSSQSRERQRREMRGEIKGEPLIMKADQTFLWNRFVGKGLIELGIPTWIPPMVLGFVQVFEEVVNEKALKVCLISRKGVERAGLRFTARGANIYGDVANFVETEFVVGHGDCYCGFVQVRGSAPLLWTQKSCLRLRPQPKLKDVDAWEGGSGLQQMAFDGHYGKLEGKYGPVTTISLIEHEGAEGALSSCLRQCENNFRKSEGKKRGDGGGSKGKVKFIHWNFHLETKGMRYETIETSLLEQIKNDLKEYDCFVYAGEETGVDSWQKGVIRLNCIDSLDRTNVVQSVIAHYVLKFALIRIGVFGKDDRIENIGKILSGRKYEQFDRKFKHLWADHADAISKAYAGSGALKTDFTRTGKRTRKGQMMDGINAMIRFLVNNFFDGNKQDGLDLLLGVVRLRKNPTGSTRDLETVMRKDEPLSVMEMSMAATAPALLGLGVFLWFAGSRWWMRWIIGGACIGIGISSISNVFAQGERYVNRPTLNGTS